MDIAGRLHNLQKELPDTVKLLAISKYHPAEAIEEAYRAGQRLFGENHVQEMTAKQALLPKDIEWHFTGHVQSNKIKYMAPYVNVIHGVDSFRKLQEIDKQAAKYSRTIRCFLQIHIASEETKFGLAMDECRQLLRDEPWDQLQHVQLIGLMAMASNTDDEFQIHNEFRQVKLFFDELKATHFIHHSEFCELSEGMSGDYRIAIAEGSTLVRIGTAIFGERQY